MDTNQESRTVALHDASELKPFLVAVQCSEKGYCLFSCLASDGEHARNQAADAYPKARMLSAEIQEFVIYSPNESATGDGAGFWSLEKGWVELNAASLYTKSECELLSLPGSLGHDARWVPYSDAHQHYGQ